MGHSGLELEFTSLKVMHNSAPHTRSISILFLHLKEGIEIEIMVLGVKS